jgi:hypothetical protein
MVVTSRYRRLGEGAETGRGLAARGHGCRGASVGGPGALWLLAAWVGRVLDQATLGGQAHVPRAPGRV